MVRKTRNFVLGFLTKHEGSYLKPIAETDVTKKRWYAIFDKNNFMLADVGRIEVSVVSKLAAMDKIHRFEISGGVRYYLVGSFEWFNYIVYAMPEQLKTHSECELRLQHKLTLIRKQLNKNYGKEKHSRSRSARMVCNQEVNEKK